VRRLAARVAPSYGARSSPLPPGVKDFEGAPRSSGVNVEREMIHEINADGEPSWDDDIFHPGL
jgi:hypothetical protein